MRGEQSVIPTSMRFEIVDRVHRSMDHQGAERTVRSFQGNISG